LSAKRKAEPNLAAAVDQAKKPTKYGSPVAKILVETYWDSPLTQIMIMMLSKSLSNELNGYSRQIRQVMAGVKHILYR
jgi:hypothetical protein